MGIIAKIFLALIFGIAIGYYTEQRTVDQRGQAIATTYWRNWQGGRSDPYALAHYLDEGMLPPDGAQWSVYETTRDSQGASLRADCVYALAGKMPEGRWWRLSAEGKGVTDPENHPAWLQSDTAILEPDGSVRIAVAPTPRSSNWIMPGDISSMRLLLFVLEERKKLPLPDVTRISCP